MGSEMKLVSQLDSDGYFVGATEAHESPLEPGIYLIPGGAVDIPAPDVPNGKRAKWVGEWVYEDLPVPEPDPEDEILPMTYAEKRAMEYPSPFDYLDGIVKNDQAQITKYIDDCLAVKAKYPKE